MLTPEQRAVVETELQAGESLKVVAYAGTGKTLSLKMWAYVRPHLRILYLAVSLSIEEEKQEQEG